MRKIIGLSFGREKWEQRGFFESRPNGGTRRRGRVRDNTGRRISKSFHVPAVELVLRRPNALMMIQTGYWRIPCWEKPL